MKKMLAEAIRAGEILPPADRLAVYGIEYAREILKGGKPKDKQAPVDLITAEDFSK